MLQELRQLNQIRLEMDLTWKALSEACRVHPNTLYRLVTRPGARPNERTLYKIRAFLKSRQAAC